MNIILACASGMSTSLVAKKMVEAAKERNIECKIWAVSQDRAAEEMKDADVILIGPQMRFLKKKLEVTANELGVAIDVIKPLDYGRCDGNAILSAAIALLEK